MERNGNGAEAPAAAPAHALEALVAAEVERRLAPLREELARLEARTVGNRATMVVFSGDLDKVLASLVIATGAAAMGLEVSMFFTFWGLSAVKKERRLSGKNALEKAFAAMTPGGISSLPVSKLNFGGAGAVMLRKMMKDAEVASVEEMFALARESGVRMVACTMSMDVMGVKEDELVDGIELGGVATYLGDAADSKVTLFV